MIFLKCHFAEDRTVVFLSVTYFLLSMAVTVSSSIPASKQWNHLAKNSLVFQNRTIII